MTSLCISTNWQYFNIYFCHQQESQQKILEESLQINEPFKVHSKLLDIYVELSKHQELVALVDLMMRKYKRDPNTYIMCGAACFKLGLVDKARQVSFFLSDYFTITNLLKEIFKSRIKLVLNVDFQYSKFKSNKLMFEVFLDYLLFQENIFTM